MKRSIATILVLGLSFGFTGLADAGSVTGDIVLPPRPSASPSVSLYGKYCGHCSHTVPALGDYAMVCLIPREPTSRRRNRPAPIMDQKNTRFAPRVLPVQVGEQVQFLNSDPVFHNVFSLSPSKKFDLGRYRKGGSKFITFEKSGVVQVFCDIHAEMVGFVVVVETPFFATIDAVGDYQINDVPEGKYDVLVWSEGMTHFQSVGEVEVTPTGPTEFTAKLLERP